MKNILIIADGIVAKHFLERVCNDTTADNNYSVVYYDDKTIANIKTKQIKLHKFDPTSFAKLRSVFRDSIVEVFIIVKKRFDAIESYKNIRLLSKDIHVVMLDKWHIDSDDANLSLVDANEVLSSRLFDFLPNVSVIAQYVGLGIGEIMEIDVPFGSSYVYRHISSIKQKNWRISAIYRANSMILPKPSTMIYPNDILLVIGDPNILQSVNISIKQEFGSFPAPYGKNIYLLVDMAKSSSSEIERMLNSALLLHARLNNNKFIIKIINPTYSKCFDKLKSHDKGSTRVFIDYEVDNFKNALFRDLDIANIGLMIVDNKIFKRYKSALYDAKIPIFKIGDYDFSKIKQSVILPEEGTQIEKMSATIFDISAQLDLDIELYDYDPEEMDINDELIDHFKNLASMFKRKVNIVKPKNNPLKELESREDIMQFLPFDKKVKNSTIFLSQFSKSFQKLYYKLNDTYQVFIPTTE